MKKHALWFISYSFSQICQQVNEKNNKGYQASNLDDHNLRITGSRISL